MIISDLALQINNSRIYGNAECEIECLNLCNRDTRFEHILSYVVDDSWGSIVNENRSVCALMCREEDAAIYLPIVSERNGAIIVCRQPERDFYELHEKLCSYGEFYQGFGFSAQVGRECRIADSAIIENGVIIGNNVKIGSNTFIGRGTKPDEGVMIGNNCSVGANGFQIIKVNGIPRNVTHVGGVHIGRNSYIGDNVCISRSLFEGYTELGANVMIDNLIHIAHNCIIGDNAVITAGCVLCGTSTIEKGAWLGMNTTVLNRVVVGYDSLVGIGSVVTRDITKGTIAYGNPARIARSNK